MGHKRGLVGASTGVLCTLVCVGWTMMDSKAHAQDRSDLESYIGALVYYLDKDAKVRFRGQDRARKKQTQYVKAQQYIPGNKFPHICDLKLKKKNIRGSSRSWEYIVIPLNRVDTTSYTRTDYRQDAHTGNMEYYGHSVTFQTKWWDMTVINRVKEPTTREKEFEVVFAQEKTARAFMSLLTQAAGACRLQRSGVGNAWNKR